MRFLTFICFLNFSGLNNGYTFIQTVSPLNVSGSVSLMHQSVQACRKALNSRIVPSLGSAHELITVLTLKMEREFPGWARQSFLNPSRPIFSAGFSLGQRYGVPENAGVAVRESYLRQENYLRENKEESWDKFLNVFDFDSASGPKFSASSAAGFVTRSSRIFSGRSARRVAFYRIHHSSGNDPGSRILKPMRFMKAESQPDAAFGLTFLSKVPL